MTTKTASRWGGLAASLTLFALVAAPQVAGGQGANQAPAAPAGGGQPQGRGGGGGRGGNVAFGPPTTQTRYDDYTGFTKIFDGQTFTNWNGERDVWSIVDGMLHADTTKTPGQHHIHYTGPGAVMRDFTPADLERSSNGGSARHSPSMARAAGHRGSAPILPASLSPCAIPAACL